MNGQVNRLPEGGLIDRSRPLSFSFEGRRYQGFAGDTLASALLANGVKLVGRSFKYHRPRGIIAAGPEECNALVTVGTGAEATPNLRVTEVPLSDGLVAMPVNCWPNLRYDLGSVNQLLAPFLSAGFYYKTFMWPDWHLFEGFIRRAAGLGKLPDAPDPARYEHRFAHCDVLVIGGGAAGIAAAQAAASGGARVMVVEQESLLGGQLLWDGGEIDGTPARAWAQRGEANLRSMPDVRVLTATTAVGYFDHNALTLIETLAGGGAKAGAVRYRLWEVRAIRVVLATGSLERPLVFPGNDRPGVMLASAIRHYIGRFAVRPGQSLVVFANNDEAYRTALAFHNAGGRVAALVDTRDAVPAAVQVLAAQIGAPLHAGAVVTKTRGGAALRGVTIRLGNGRGIGVNCDVLASSGGRNPNVQLFSQSGGRLAFDTATAAFVPATGGQEHASVGGCTGILTLGDALQGGHEAGLRSAGAAICAPPLATVQHPPPAIEACWHVDAPGKAFVDLQNDVTRDDIRLAERENFVSVEHLKRYTTLGMATDQGKTANVNALAIMAQLTGRSIEDTGTTRFRFPFVPTALGAFAGASRGGLLRPLPQLPLHQQHVAHDGVMEDFGGWSRAAYYRAQPGETRHEAMHREALAVREGVGLFDSSTLGKIEVKGRDAGRLLDFVYANTMSNLKIGALRYGLMLNELGVIIDDGICARLGDDHFMVGTSSAGADRIAAWLEEWLQCEFVDYEVLTMPVTTSRSVLTLTGPKAQSVLARLWPDFDIAMAAFAHMQWRDGHLGGIPVRVFRVSYTGEVSYEISVANSDAGALWQTCLREGADKRIVPVGIEAWNLLRLEKGYLHVGADTDGTNTPLNIGWERVLARKADFVGKRSLLRAGNQSPDRLQLVGLASHNAAALPIGAHIVDDAAGRITSGGYVTSSEFSPTLNRPVAMAMVRAGAARLGQSVVVRHGGSDCEARIVPLAAYDPEGARLHV